MTQLPISGLEIHGKALQNGALATRILAAIPHHASIALEALMVIFLVTLVLVAHDHKIVHQLDHLRLYSRLLFVKCGCVCV